MAINDQKTILFVLPDHFSVRNFVYSPFINQDFAKNRFKIVFVLRKPEVHQKQSSFNPNIVFEDLEENENGFWLKLNKKIINFIYETLTYRFNKRRNSQSLAVKEAIPKEYIVSQYDQVPFSIKFPWPKSLLLYYLFYQLYNSSLFSQGKARGLIAKHQPHLLITSDPQTLLSRSYLIEAKKRKIKTLCYINSWDYLTTDGPVLKKIDEFIIWSKQMRDELVNLNQIEKPVHQIGPLHFDYSFKKEYIWSKETLGSILGINPNKTIITYGVCGERVGRHEPEIACWLAEYLKNFPERHLIIRGHPADKTIPQRFRRALQYPNVSLCMGHHFDDEQEKTGYDDVKMLYSLISHSAVILCGGTTLTLDGLRFEKPVINIAFDGNLKLPKTASVIKEYKFDHYAPLLSYNVIYLVKSFAELKNALEKAIANPNDLLLGIKKLKAQYLEPLDGKASERMFNIIKNA